MRHPCKGSNHGGCIIGLAEVPIVPHQAMLPISIFVHAAVKSQCSQFTRRLQELLEGEGSLGEELLTSWRSSWLLRGEPVLEGELLDPWRRSSVGSPWLLGGSYYVEDSSIIMESKSSKLVIVGGSLRRVAICEMLQVFQIPTNTKSLDLIFTFIQMLSIHKCVPWTFPYYIYVNYDV